VSRAAPTAKDRLCVASVTRVLPVPGNLSQGIFIDNRLNAMAELMDVHRVQPVPYLPFVRPLPAWAKQPEDSLARVPMLYIPGILKSLDAYFLRRSIRQTIIALHRTNPIDVLDAHFGYPDGAAVVNIGRELGIPSVITLRGVENEQLATRSIGRLLRYAIRSADGVICVSHFLADLAIRSGADPDRVRVIHNAVDRQVFSPACRTKAKERAGLSQNRPVIVSVGHLVERKGHHVLVDAMQEVLLKVPDAQLLIIGALADRSYVRRIETMITSYGLESSVNLLGNVEPSRIPTLLQAADAFGLMTAREGCCNAVLEALACGIPVVTTNAGDNAYFVQDSVNGYITDRGAASCAVALVSVLRDNHFRQSEISASLSIGGWQQVAAEAERFLRETVLRVRS